MGSSFVERDIGENGALGMMAEEERQDQTTQVVEGAGASGGAVAPPQIVEALRAKREAREAAGSVTVEPLRPDYDHKLLTAKAKSVCRLWLVTWGAVVRERKVTGDPSAIPAGEATVSGGKRGSPSDMPGVLEMYLDVEKHIGKLDVLRAALELVYCDGWEWKTTAVHFRFEDGTSTKVELGVDPSDGQEKIRYPVAFVEAKPVSERAWTEQPFARDRVRSIFSESHWQMMGLGLKGTGYTQEEFVKHLVESFERLLINKCRLRDVARSYLERGIEVPD